jgi:cytochrome c556
METFMLRYRRTAWLAAAIVISTGMTAAIAQDPVSARRAVMKTFDVQHYGTLGAIARGRQPYDQAKVDAALAAMAEASAKLVPALFPADSLGKPDEGSNYYASPKATDAAAIQKHAADLTRAINEVRGTVKDTASALAAYQRINEQCNSCHNDFRLRKS